MQACTARSVRRGWTLIEAGAVLAIFAVLGAVAAPAFDQVKHCRALDGVAAEVGADLQFARAEALARNEGLRISFQSHPAGMCMIVHTRSKGDCQCDADDAAQCANGASLVKSLFRPTGDGVAITASVDSMLFEPKFGTVTPAGSGALTNVRGQAVRHVVNMVGRVRSCSPQGNVSGYKAC